MNFILSVLLIISLVWGYANRIALKSLGLYFQKKGYTKPTDEELKECSREVLKQAFKKE